MEKTQKLFDAEIKRKRDLLLLKNACDFPAIMHYWQRTQKTFEETGYKEYKDPSAQNRYQNPATAHYQANAFDFWTHPMDADYTVELARFAVPYGGIGVIRRLYQWVSGFCEATDWGNPVKGNADVDSIEWFLRVEQFTGALPARLISPSPALPGAPYDDLNHIRYLWFMPHSGDSQVNLVVPGKSLVRFVARCPIPQVEYRIMGRLAGYVQSSEYNNAAGFNASKGF